MPGGRTSPPLPHEIDDFEIVQESARSGQGTIYKVQRQAEDGTIETCALKVLDAADEDEHDPERLLRAHREGQLLSKLPPHPHLVGLIDYFILDDQDRVCLLLDWIEGPTWADLPTPLPWHWALVMGMQAADGLGQLHTRRILHRDLKPSNLMLNEHGRCIVVDLGLALDVDGAPDSEDSGRLTRSPLGTPGYIPMEAQRGEWTPQTDVLQLGSTLRDMLRVAGSGVGAAVPWELRNLINQCHLPSDYRPKTMEVLKDKLQAILDQYAHRAGIADPVAVTESELAAFVRDGTMAPSWLPPASVETVCEEVFGSRQGAYQAIFGDAWDKIIDALRPIYPVTKAADLQEAMRHLSWAFHTGHKVRTPGGLANNKICQVQQGDVHKGAPPDWQPGQP